MKTLRKLFYGISLCIFLVCVAILVFTSNPEWSDKLSKMLYGEEEQQNVATTTTPMPEKDEDMELQEPQLTPLVYSTPTPLPGEEPVESSEPENYKPHTIDVKTVVPQKAPIVQYNAPLSDKVTIPEEVSTLRGMEELTATMAEVKKEEGR